jgi:hypothetical protein
MSRTTIWAGLAALCVTFVASDAMAGPISNACMRSNRQAANPALCGCIQQVADQMLPGADQRRAATFFRDPDKAQQVFLSQKRADDAFWERYKAFGARASAACGS